MWALAATLIPSYVATPVGGNFARIRGTGMPAPAWPPVLARAVVVLRTLIPAGTAA